MSSPAADWLHEFSIVGNSTMPSVTVSNVPGTTTGVCVLIAVPASTTVYLGMPAAANTPFRILGFPIYPVHWLTPVGHRHYLFASSSNPDDIITSFYGDHYTCNKNTNHADSTNLFDH